MAKQYNPWTGFLEDTTTKTHDAMMFVQLRFGSGKIEGAKLDESEFREYAEALLKKYGEKIVTLSKNGKAIATYTARDEKPTIDKAIRSCDVNKAEGFKIYNAYVRNDTLYIEYEDLLYGNGKKEKESFTRTEAKKLLTDPWNTWFGTSKMIVKQFAG